MLAGLLARAARRRRAPARRPRRSRRNIATIDRDAQPGTEERRDSLTSPMPEPARIHEHDEEEHETRHRAPPRIHSTLTDRRSFAARAATIAPGRTILSGMRRCSKSVRVIDDEHPAEDQRDERLQREPEDQAARRSPSSAVPAVTSQSRGRSRHRSQQRVVQRRIRRETVRERADDDPGERDRRSAAPTSTDPSIPRWGCASCRTVARIRISVLLAHGDDPSLDLGWLCRASSTTVGSNCGAPEAGQKAASGDQQPGGGS